MFIFSVIRLFQKNLLFNFALFCIGSIYVRKQWNLTYILYFFTFVRVNLYMCKQYICTF